MTQESLPIPGEAAPKKQRRPRQEKAQTVRNADLHNAGRILPNCPTMAEDLVEQWQIPGDDAYSVRVAVMKQNPGDPGPQLMASVPVLDYDMGTIAGKYGAGLYFIKGQPHKWAVHSARFEVSEEYARANGFGRMPARAVDLVAARTLQEATKGPSDPASLLAAVETMMDRKLSELRGQVEPIQVMTGGPMQSMERQAESMFHMLNVMDKMEGRLMAIAERRAGLRPESDPIPESSSILDLFKAVAPMLTPIIQRIAGGPAPAPAAHPAAPAILNPPATQPANPEGKAAMLPSLTEEEKARMAPTVRALRPYAAMLANLPADAGKSDEEIADGLGSYIPPALYPGMMDLCGLVEKKGPAVLGYIDPALVHDRWRGILAQLGKMLGQAVQGDEG